LEKFIHSRSLIMIELIIAFLFSVGWLRDDNNLDNCEITQVNETTYGIVITDGVQQKGTIVYDETTGTFSFE
jgi:hypothetical protein